MNEESPADESNSGLPTNSDQDVQSEELVAYLDGELSAAAARAVEQRLAQDAAYRRHLQQLQQSWDLLDQLPSAAVDEHFTPRTIAMIALTAAVEVEQIQTRQATRKRSAWWLAAVSAGVAFAAGFALVAAAGRREDRQLLRDLPVIENLDEYRFAGDLDFLKQLDQEGLFAADEPNTDL